MSGIAGIIHFDGRPVAPGQIESMTAAMDYRGPDGIGHWVGGSVALGQCMLRTTTESLEEIQPLANEDASLILVMDGRIDNWEDLRRELLGRNARLRTRADAELFLRAYEAWGEKCLAHIDGDFAVAIWDTRTRSLFCARDRVGNRQFHYHWNGCSFAFATDLHPVLNLPWVPEHVDEDTLAEYLATDWLTIDTTLWQRIKRLKPAQHISVSGTGKLQFVEYWAPDPFAVLPCTSDEDYIAYYGELFTDVVRRTLRSHRPLAIEVSGGLDSSSIFAVAMQLRSNGRLLAPSTDGYTLDFSGDLHADELHYALQVGRHYNTPIHAVPPAFPPLDWYSDIARRFRAFPDFPNGAMHQGIVEQAHEAGSRVLVSGTGGDEWTGGGMHYAEALQSRRWDLVRCLWGKERQAFGLPKAGARLLRQGVISLLPDNTKRSLREARDIAIRRGAIRRDWLTPELRQRLESLRRVTRDSQPGKPVARLGQHRQHGHVHGPYWQFSKTSMERRLAVSGLEWRQPYWNYRIIEFAFATPEYVRNRLDQNKYLQRQVMRGLLPDNVRLRQGKAEFSSSFRHYWPALRESLTGLTIPRRRSWVLPEPLLSRLDTAFTPHSTEWNEGPPWMLFGLDMSLPASYKER